MATVLAFAENFAFGPVGRLLTIAPNLKKHGHKLIFIGYGTAYQLAKNETYFNEVYEINTASSDFEKKATPIVRNADIVLSVLERRSIQLAQKLKIPTIWVDSLFHFWDTIPDFLLDVDLYIKQKVIDDSKNMAKYGRKIKNLKEVGPIVDLSVKNEHTTNQVLVSYGGMEAYGWYKVGEDTIFPNLMTRILVEQVDFTDFNKVIITGNERVIKQLKQSYGSRKFIFQQIPHSVFIKELKKSKLLMITPGMMLPMESLSSGVPTIFLLPSNITQYLHLDDFRHQNVALASVHMRDYFNEIIINGRNNQKEALFTLFKQFKQIERSPSIQRDIAKKLTLFIHDKKLLNEQKAAQKKYIAHLGNDGLQKTIQIIDEFIRYNAEN